MNTKFIMQCALSYKATKHQRCQFNADDFELSTFDNKNWCIFHLPIMNQEGILSEKAHWTPEQTNHFSKLLRELLRSKHNNFNFVVFPKNFKISFSSFKTSLFFKNAEFWSNVNIERKIFHKRVSFEGSVFKEHFFSHRALFEKRIKFIRAVFSKGAYFNDVVFDKGVNFSQSIFEENACFRGSIISQKQSERKSFLDDVKFKKEVIFKNASFYSFVSFQRTQFDDQADFSVSVLKKEKSYLNEIDFRGSSFNGLNFTNRSLEPINFDGCIFNKAPEFHGCTIHPDTVFPNERSFKDFSSVRAANAYRTLNLIMANFRARPEENMFYMLEQKSRFKDMGWFEKNLSHCYKISANHGLSTGKPLILLMGSVLLFAFYYAYLAASQNNSTNITWAILKEGLHFSFQQAIYMSKVYSVSDDLFTASLVKASSFVQSVGLAQTLISYIFVTLFVFSVRWKLKRI